MQNMKYTVSCIVSIFPRACDCMHIIIHNIYICLFSYLCLYWGTVLESCWKSELVQITWHGSLAISHWLNQWSSQHYDDAIMDPMASQITSHTIVYSTVYSGADQSWHQSSASLAFVWGIHRWPVNSPHKWPVTRKIFPFDDVIMTWFDTSWNSMQYSYWSRTSITGERWDIYLEDFAEYSPCFNATAIYHRV